VAEWLMAPVLKTGVPERVPGVRIPPSPPRSLAYGNLAVLTPKYEKDACISHTNRNLARVMEPVLKRFTLSRHLTARAARRFP
jgi:hypothetical protein